ncbi:hypothetical protein [Sinorhizobium sp. NFACC03]|uniref:hypothetical protein n=1 Tax=Sinorhizobium sp. NFACC03 TaxID=1566295 RepID=UPI00089276C6|nr:hypothetical protein [Sinorhizobium sp. NFACC03]SDA39457.1 hypothetical protein SAMN03159448_00189 [Sinorhizobium sp. NFACC03]
MPDLIALPNVVYGPSISFDPIRTRSTSRMLGRRTETLLRGTPFWVATYAAGKLTAAEAAAFDAFNMLASDGGVFAGYDPHRPRPIAYQGDTPLSGVKAGGGAFDGSAVLQSITNPLSIVVNGLPAGFQLSAGDYVEVRKAPLVRSLHRITAPAFANAAGVVTLAIRFALDTQTFAAGNAVHFEKPACIMEMDEGSYSLPKSWPNYNVQFTATELFFS